MHLDVPDDLKMTFLQYSTTMKMCLHGTDSLQTQFGFISIVLSAAIYMHLDVPDNLKMTICRHTFALFQLSCLLPFYYIQSKILMSMIARNEIMH